MTAKHDLEHAQRGTAHAFQIAAVAQRRAAVWRAVAIVACLVALLVTLVGCELQPVPIAVVDERTEPGVSSDALVAGACEALALECYPAPAGWGVVKVRIVDDAGPGIRGKTEGRGLCEKGLRAEPHADTIAHELAHVFLLEHVDDPSNLMHESERERDVDASLESWQYTDMHESAARFVGGCL